MTPNPEGQTLPVVGGIRQRGIEMTRLETFTDAAFAFALTLLVISFDAIPGSMEEFLAALKRIPVFAASFAQIAVFWYGHHLWSRNYGLDDGRTALLSLLLVFTTLVYVYPLRIIFSAFFAWITGGWIPFELGRSGAMALDQLFLIYSIGFIAMSGCLILLYRHALSCSEALQLNERERFMSRWQKQNYQVYAVTGAVCAVVSLLLPSRLGGLAGYVYGSLAVSMPLFNWLKLRQARRLGYGDD